MSTRTEERGNLVFACKAMAIMFATVALGGCGGGDGIERVEITGKVSYQGQPVEEGIISFYPIGSGIASGAKIVEGEYQAKGRGAVPVGNYKVSISWMKEEPSLASDLSQGTPTINLIPAKYNSQTELTLDLSDDEKRMTLDYELK